MMGLYCGDAHVAEEIVQEAMARLCRQWPRLPTESDARRWLTRVAFNLAKSSFRMRSGRQRILDRYGGSLGSAVTADGAGQTVDVLAVRAAVAALPHRQRRVIVLRYFCDLPVAEVAAVMGCRDGTVKSLTSLAVSRLRTSGLEFDDD
jgi:RNA polymerase sigma factor (sigma-70 family)